MQKEFLRRSTIGAALVFTGGFSWRCFPIVSKRKYDALLERLEQCRKDFALLYEEKERLRDWLEEDRKRERERKQG